MKLETEFIRLPLRVDATRLAAEVESLPEAAWLPHPQGFAGNSALPLVSVDGDPTSDAVAGPMEPTPFLAGCPYLMQVLASFHAPIGRARLMRLDGNADAQTHSDISYYWFDRARVHVPVVTHRDVKFHCGERSLPMAAGEVWIFDTWRQHRVTNPRPTRRIHLVVDTVGSADFWSMVDRGDRIFAADRKPMSEVLDVTFEPNAQPELRFERCNWPAILPASQVRLIAEHIRSGFPPLDERVRAFDLTLTTFVREWSGIWALHGDDPSSRATYEAACARFGDAFQRDGQGVILDNGAPASAVASSLLITGALRPTTNQQSSRGAARATRAAANQNATAAPAPTPLQRASLERPIFIVCPPRSGSSLLFETLSQSPDLVTIGGESHRAIEGIAALHPSSHGYASNRLTASDAKPEVVAQLQAALWRETRTRDGLRPAEDAQVRLLEKTPKNSLRVPFLAAAFPEAYFVYLYRDPRETLSSMLDAWRSSRFVTYPELPGWKGQPWSLLLTPGWRELSGRPLAEIVAQQWLRAADQLLDDLEALPPHAWCVASYDRLLAEPKDEIERLCGFLDVDWDRALDLPLPLSRTTLTSPDPEKWRRNASELESMLPIVEDVAARARMLFASPPATKPVRAVVAAKAKATHAVGPASADFRSVFTQSIPKLLSQIGATVAITTYQSGRVILARADGDTLNTHLCAFPMPMGLAIAPGRLALGTQREIVEFFDMPAVSKQLEPAGKHDAVYVPRTSSVTGDIRIHEIAYARNQLWVANTRFSTLCTLDGQHSFVPRWRPPFVTELTPDDRCHLNGICVVDDQVRYVTVLGRSNEAGGWRRDKAAGGCILEVPSGEVIVEGLSMPHSPRWHDGALWVLESGKGELAVVDLTSRKARTVARLEGFTRGLAFAGPFAFIGLSQVRESNVFGGLPVTESAKDRKCGVWVIDTRNGQTVGFLRFEGTVEEIFDVQILFGARFAEILEPANALLNATFAIPQTALADVPAALKSTA